LYNNEQRLIINMYMRTKTAICLKAYLDSIDIICIDTVPIYIYNLHFLHTASETLNVLPTYMIRKYNNRCLCIVFEGGCTHTDIL